MPTSAQVRVIDPILSTVVQGYRHAEHVGNALFPRVPVLVSGGKIIEFGKESFRLYSTARAPGAATKRIQFGHEGKPFALENHALDAPVPREYIRDAQQVPGIDLGTRAVKLTMATMSLALEYQQATIATDPNNYDANHKITLSGTDQWTDGANSDPITHIDDAREAIRASVGLYPNTLLLSAKAAKALRRHPAIVDRYKYVEGGVVTLPQIAELFEVDEVVVGKAITFDANDTATDVWGKHAVLAYVPKAALSVEEPSYGYTYAMEGHPFVEEPYWDKGSKSWIYGVAYERAPVLSGMLAGYLIQNAVA